MNSDGFSVFSEKSEWVEIPHAGDREPIGWEVDRFLQHAMVPTEEIRCPFHSEIRLTSQVGTIDVK